jgi:hypothetical protein
MSAVFINVSHNPYNWNTLWLHVTWQLDGNISKHFLWYLLCHRNQMLTIFSQKVELMCVYSQSHTQCGKKVMILKWNKNMQHEYSFVTGCYRCTEVWPWVSSKLWPDDTTLLFQMDVFCASCFTVPSKTPKYVEQCINITFCVKLGKTQLKNVTCYEQLMGIRFYPWH